MPGGRPRGRQLTPTERRRLCKLRQVVADNRYPTDELARRRRDTARRALRDEVLDLHRDGASVAAIAAGLNVAKSRAGKLLTEAKATAAAATPNRSRS